jgi:hypothetical protein
MTDTSKAATTSTEAKPDVSELGAEELLPKLLDYFHNNTEELARALGVQREIVDTWVEGTGGPNESTVMRMRRIVQERHIK